MISVPDMIGLQTQDLLDLAAKGSTPCVSLYMPTHRKGPEVTQDAKRFKNLVREARIQCQNLGVTESRIEQVLARTESIARDRDFWQHRDCGLAALLAAETVFLHSLNYQCDELLIVADRFHVKPLLSMLDDGARFLVLAVSQNLVRVFEGSRFTMRELRPENAPTSLAEALWMDNPEKSLQLHTLSSPKTGRGEAVFHGHGSGGDDAKTDLLRYFRAIDQALCAYAGKRTVPLVLACVDYYLPLYRSVSTYPDLVDEVIPGNPESMSPRELHERAWELLRDRLANHEREAEARLVEASGAGRVETDAGEIVVAAKNGRISELFVALDVPTWGRPSRNAMDPPTIHDGRQPGDVDLLDLASVWTLEKGGEVFPRMLSEIPGRVPAAAMLRY